MKKKKLPEEATFCEIIPGRTKLSQKENKSAFYKHKGDFRWAGIKDAPYKPKGPCNTKEPYNKENEWSNIIRRVLIGDRGESAKFHVRYFEIMPGGNSSLERHRHEHVVICVKGEGVVITGSRGKKMSFMDTLYISPDTIHQLKNPFNEPFGFLCIVNARRDRPKVLKD